MSSGVESLLKPLVIGRTTISNRFVMAPLTRCRADDDHVPTAEMVKYYEQRAGFGLIIAEATQIQKGYSSFAYEGGIFGKEQVAGWRKVTDAVHAKGGVIFSQIHHCGRTTAACNVDAPLRVVSSAENPIVGHECPASFARDGQKQTFPVPHSLTKAEIDYHVQLYATAAKNAMAAGFDGVEIHGANSYLIDQFLKSECNTRTDEYGGSIENRCRFLFEVVEAVVAAVGKDRVGLRISPINSFNGMGDENPEALTKYICEKLNNYKIAFLDVLRGDLFDPTKTGADTWAREVYTGVLISGGGFQVEDANAAVEGGAADAICFGRAAIANPDFVKRAIAGAELNEPKYETFYTRGAEGYTDYPCMEPRRSSVRA